jgi:hypothetical protein
MDIQEMVDSCFCLKRKVPFLTDWFRPNLHSLYSSGIECRVCCIRHPTAVTGEMGRKNSFGLKCKVPFVTDLFRQNLHSL